MDTILKLIGVVLLIGLISNWLEDNESEPSSDGPSKTELKIAEMTKGFSTITSPTNFQTTKIYNMTDIQRDNWKKENKDKLHLVRNKVYEVQRDRDKLTATGGYNTYTIQFMDSIEDGVNKSFSNSSYQNIGFQCDKVYAYNQKEKNAIESLSVGRTTEIIAAGIELGSFWNTADICVVKGIH